MTETSGPWDGTSVGDAATTAPYDAPSEFALFLRDSQAAAAQSAHKGGVVNGAVGFSGYSASLPGGGVARIASGIGWNQGTRAQSDANVDFAIPTPASATRIDRIVLRKVWAAQTIRLVKIAGTEGAGVPAMTQTFGTTWDVPLWQASITTGGVITLTDERVFLLVAQHNHSATTDGGPVAHTSLTSIGTNTHATIDSKITTYDAKVVTYDAHVAANLVGGAHGVTVLNTTGTQSMGASAAGKVVLARANAGTLTVTVPSGVIFVGNANMGASFAITSGDSYTFESDGVHHYVF